MRHLRRAIALAWASPYTLLGLLLGGIGLCTGGHCRRRAGVLEFYEGGVRRMFQLFPDGDLILGFTLGHVVLGPTSSALDVAREHELVHVRQYERWGPLLGPAYLLCSLCLWLAGRDAYRDNPFEREAFGHSDGK